jgi:hypothetical protein
MIIAIDPGKISGIAVYDGSSQFRTYEHDVQSTIRFVDNVWHQLHGDIEVVTEKFTISERTLKTALSLDALDINGWLVIESQRRDFPLKIQTPAQAKSFSTDDKLKALGWFNPSLDGHANDAARHLMVYLITQKPAVREVLVPQLAKALLT